MIKQRLSRDISSVLSLIISDFAESFSRHFLFLFSSSFRGNTILTGRNRSKTSASTTGLDYLPRTNLAEVSNNDESIMNIQRIREFVRTLSIMDICWPIPDSLDVFAFKTVGKCWSAKFSRMQHRF